MRRRWLNIRKAMLGWVLPGLRVLPPRLATRLVARIGRTEYALLPGLRHCVDVAVERGGHHFGSHMMPAHWLVRAGYPLRLFMERPRHISKFLSREFEADGPMAQKKLF